MNILTAIFGSEDAKAKARALDIEAQKERDATIIAIAKEKTLRQKQKQNTRVSVSANRSDVKKTVSTNNAASRDKLAADLSPAAAIAALGQLDFSQKTANVQARQAGMTQRNADRAAAGDTTTPAQDILAEVGAIFSSESQGAQDNFTKLAGAYLGSKGLSSADGALLNDLTQGAGASASVSTPVGSASASASSGILPLLGLGLGIAALAMSGGKK